MKKADYKIQRTLFLVSFSACLLTVNEFTRDWFLKILDYKLAGAWFLSLQAVLTVLLIIFLRKAWLKFMRY